MIDNKADNKGVNVSLMITDADPTKIPTSINDPVIKNTALVLGQSNLLDLCVKHGIKRGELQNIAELVEIYKTNLQTIVKYWKMKTYSLEQVECALELRERFLNGNEKFVLTLTQILKYLRAFHDGDGCEADDVYDELTENGIMDYRTLRDVVKVAEENQDIMYPEVALQHLDTGRPLHLTDILHPEEAYNIAEGGDENECY
jgi:hypothetical protein